MKRKSTWIILLTGLILGLAFSPQSARAWQTHNGPGAQTVPTAPPTPTNTRLSGGGANPQPAASETAAAYQPPAAATQAGGDNTPYPLPGMTNETLEAYPFQATTASPASGDVKETTLVTENRLSETSSPLALPSATPAPLSQENAAGWVGYAAAGLVLVLAAGVYLFWRSGAAGGK